MSQTFLFKAKNAEQDFGSSYNQARYIAHLSDNEGKEFEIKRRKEKRTLSQNAFYWANLNNIERETGNNSDDMHEDFRRRLLPPKFIHIREKTRVRELKIPRSTTDLSKTEMSDYLDKISAETEIALLSPEDVGYMTK